MILADFIIYGILLGWLTRGRLGNLKQVNIPFFWLIIIGFVLRYVALNTFIALAPWLTLAGMGVVFVGTILSCRISGMFLVAGGTLLNILVMAVNRGQMPVSVPLAHRLGHEALVLHLEAGQMPDYTVLTAVTPLALLGDIVPYYSLLFFQPFVVSIGDYLLGLGVAWFLIKAMKGKRVER